MGWWTDVWTNWSAWWQLQAWGTVPDWFAAVGTVGALAVALGIILNDRKFRSRELAESLNATWSMVATAETASYELRATVFNAGTKPAHGVQVRTYVSGLFDRLLTVDPQGDSREGSADAEHMLPGTTLRFVTRIAGRMGDHHNDVLLTFTDGNGRRWVRNLSKGTLKDARKVKMRDGAGTLDILSISPVFDHEPDPSQPSERAPEA